MSNADRLALRYCEEGEDNYAVTPDISTNAVTFSMDSTDNSINDSGNGFVTAGWKAGMKMKVVGFTEAANNENFIVESVAAGKIIFTPDNLVTTEIAGDSVTLSAPVLKELRITGEGLAQETDIVLSNEMRSDRQKAEVVRTNIRASGDINFELSYDDFDVLFAAALQSAGWSDLVTDTQITFSTDSGDNSVNDSGSGFVAKGYEADQWILISGFTTAANNGLFKIVSVAVGKLVLEGGTVVTEIAGDAVTIVQGRYIENGTTFRSFTFEKEFSDLAAVFSIFLGMALDGVSLNVKVGEIITGSLNLVGKSEDSAAATVAVASEDPGGYELLNAIDNVTALLENMTEIEITAFAFTLKNNLRARPIVGALGPDSIGSGSIEISGTLTAYFESKGLMDKYLDFDTTQLTLQLQDGDGNRYVIDLPEVRLTAGRQVAGGTNSDIIADMQFAAFLDATEGVTIRIAKFAA